MKQYMAVLFALVCVLGLAGCKTETGVHSGTDTMYQLGIQVDGVFYAQSYQPMSDEVAESAIIGYIKSYSDTRPMKDDETNISEDLIGAPYAGVEGGIAIWCDDAWYLCTANSAE